MDDCHCINLAEKRYNMEKVFVIWPKKNGIPGEIFMWLEPDDFPEFQIIKGNLVKILLLLLLLWLFFLGGIFLGLSFW